MGDAVDNDDAPVPDEQPAVPDQELYNKLKDILSLAKDEDVKYYLRSAMQRVKIKQNNE